MATTTHLPRLRAGQLLLGLCIGTAAVAWGAAHDGDRGDGHAGGHGGAANEHMHARPFLELIASFEEPEREVWQRPDAVIAALGDLEGRTVAEIGSGSGYFAFRLAAAGARVLCLDVDERFLAYVAGRRDALGLQARMEPRLVPYDSAELAPGEADLVLIVNTWHHIEHRSDYFAEVREGLAPGGELVVIDFVKRDVPVGPPPRMKLSAERVVEELRAAGYERIEVDRELLPYQYLIRAS
ncbi:MAG: class I SAM-dependent methyltransferase [Pseudomonadales bacterium]|jgi:SAM-dependent methyltransferase|nr:class I SAM-dependent methyltransferase [Pseudomonadales bacterium]